MKITNIVIAFLFAFALFSVQAQAVDIALSDVTVDKTAGYIPGEEVTISFKVTNTHTTQARQVIIKSTDLVLSGTTSKILMPQTLSIQVAAGASATSQLKVTVPSTLAGTYTATLSATQENEPSNKDEEPYSVTVLQPQIQVATQSFVVQQGTKNVARTFTIKNIGSNTLTISSSSFEHDINLVRDQNIITLTFPDVGTLSPGQSKNVNLLITVPSDQPESTYSGRVKLKDSSGITLGFFDLSLQVKEQIICVAGNVGNFIDLDVNDPDSGDEFNPGDTVRVRLNVDNQADDDLDVEVEVILYDTEDNDEIDSFDDSDSIDEDEDVDFEFEIPLDSDLEDSSSRYKLFIKAFEDGNEDEQCQEEEISLDIQREAHQITVDEVSLIPSSVNCGDTVRATASATNTGSSNERNARLKLVSLPLGIELNTETFRIDEDDDVIKDFSFAVPTDVRSGEYVIDVEPIISGSASKTGSALLKVTCNELTEPIGPTQQEIDLVDQARSLLAQRQYDQALQVLALAESLREGDQYNSLEEQIRDARATSTSTGGPVSGTQGNLITGRVSELFGSSKNAAVFWIIGDIVLVVIALYFIKLIFSRKREK